MASSSAPQTVVDSKIWFKTKNLNSILLIHPDEVESWAERFGYSSKASTFVIQYFTQLSQIFPSNTSATMEQILQARTQDIIEQQHWHLLHEHDPLRVFPEVRSADGQLLKQRGVPAKGYKFCSDFSLVEGGSYITGQQGYQLPGFRPAWQPLPVGVTLLEILRHYPNHLTYEFLDGFLQHGIIAGNMFDLLPSDILNALIENKILTPMSAYNVFLKRLKSRRNTLVSDLGLNTAGVDRLELYLSSPIKLFDVGIATSGKQLQTQRCKFCSVDDLREQVKKRSADAASETAAALDKIDEQDLKNDDDINLIESDPLKELKTEEPATQTPPSLTSGKFIIEAQSVAASEFKQAMNLLESHPLPLSSKVLLSNTKMQPLAFLMHEVDDMPRQPKALETTVTMIPDEATRSASSEVSDKGNQDHTSIVDQNELDSKARSRNSWRKLPMLMAPQRVSDSALHQESHSISTKHKSDGHFDVKDSFLKRNKRQSQWGKMENCM